MAMKTCKSCGKKYSGAKCPHCKRRHGLALAAALALLLTCAAPAFVAPVAAGELGWCEDCD